MKEEKAIIRIVAAVAVLVGLMLAWRAFETQGVQKVADTYGGRLLELLKAPFFAVGGLKVSPMFLIQAAVFLTLLLFASRTGRTFLRKRVLVRTSMDPGLQYAVEVGFGYSIIVIGLIVGLQSVGLNLSSLAFLTGIIGVGVGFGLQNIVNNFISGLILLVERPIKVGDRVELGNLTGDVVKIAARSTWVRTNDNVVIIVPNSEFISSRVTNWTANDRRVRIRMAIGVGYSSNPEVVRSVLLEVAGAHPQVLADPCPDVIFIGFGDSSLDFELRVWTEDSLRTPQILKSEIYFRVFREFGERGIEIPFPQRDVHIRSVPASAGANGGAGI